MKNSIEIKLLANRRVIYSNRKQSIIITAENRATEIAVVFPDEYEGYSKRVDFINSHGREWTEALYVPEFKEYAGDFNKNNFKFTLPSEVTTEGELKMQFLAYMPDNSMTVVPFEIITIDVQHGILAFKKNARRNPDLLILSYNQSTEALFKAEQAKAKAESAVEQSAVTDGKADMAIDTAEQSKTIAQLAEQQSVQAEAASQQAVSISEATEIKVNQIQGTSDTAVVKADGARSVADYAKSRADHAVVRAEDAVTVSTDAAGQAAQAKLKADQAAHTANTAQALIGAAITNAETALSVATNIDAKAVTALNRSQEAKDTAQIAENTAADAKIIAQDAKSLIESAKTKSESAVTTAGQADTKSSQAVSAAQAAVQTADNALSIAQSADGKADTALANSSSATATAQAAASTADTASTVAAEAKSTALDAKDTADSTSADLAAHKAQNVSALNNKVDKVTGKGLSTEDYTTAEKNKLAGIATGAEVNVQSDWAESNTNSDSYIKNKPTSMPASGGNADTVDGKHANEFATAAQGAKADSALQSFTETDPTVPAWAKQPSKPAYTPQEIGAATAAQGVKADTALQSFTETDPTVPAWAKAAAKPSYNFSEITGLMSALQLPDNLISGMNNVSANFNSATEQWDVSAEIPFVFECNGVNDNERLSNLVKDFYNSSTLADNANLKVVVKGKLGVTNTKLYGSGTYADNYRVFEFGVEGYTGNRRVFLDFSGAEVPEINTEVEGYNYYIIIYNYDIPINIYGLNLIARQTRKEGMSGSGAYLYTIKGNNYNLTECDITSLNESYNGSFAVVGADCIFNNCSFTVKGSNAVCYAINGDRAKVNNCRFYSLSGDVYTLNSVGAFVQGCHITTIGTSTTQVQCSGKNDCVFINCTLEITGRGTLRCNSGSNCTFINCTFIAESTDINSTVSANQGSNCYFMNCRLTAKGSYWSSSGVSGNSSSGCVFVASVLKATNTRSDGYAYGARIWNGVMIGCELLAYVPEGGTGEAIGFYLNSAVTNKCIIIGCRFREVAEEGYEQGPSIVIDGTDTGGEYMITNNIISGEVRTHSLTGGNYIKEPNIMEGI